MGAGASLPRITSPKLIATGTLAVLVGAAIGVPVWQSDTHHFIRLAGFWIAVALAAIGVIVFVAGVAKRDPTDSGPRQVQTAGDHSTAYQAGGDLHVRGAERERSE
jgi:hypothetical protein